MQIRSALIIAGAAVLLLAEGARAQVTPTVTAAPKQTIDVPSYRTAGAIQIIDISGNVLGTVANPLTISGSIGAGSTFGSAFPSAGTAIGFHNAGGNLDYASVDASHNVDMNCVVGCSGGTASNASSGVATSSTNGQTNAWLYGFNGATWDQLKDDGNKYLYVDIGATAANLAEETGGNLAAAATNTGTTNTDIGAPGATACSSDTGSCSINALSQRLAQRLTTINTTIGTPMQQTGGALALHQSVNVDQWNGAANGVGNPVYVAPWTGSAFTVTADAGTNLNTSSLSTSANQTNASQKTQIVDGSGNVIGSTSNNLDVQCANCSGSGVSTTDAATFTASSSLFAGAGGFYQTTATSNALTNGHQGMFQVTAQRALFTNLRDSSGNEEGLSGQPLQVSLANTGANATAVSVTAAQATAANLNATVVPGAGWFGTDEAAYTLGSGTFSGIGGYYQTTATTGPLSTGQAGIAQMTKYRSVFFDPVDSTGAEAVDTTNHAVKTGLTALAGTALGAPSNYGTSPGAVAVLGVNAFVTNNTAPMQSTGGTVGLVAGSAIIGKTGIDQTTVGSTNGVSLAQIGANTVSSGAGAVGTGSARVAVGQDPTTIAGSAPGTAAAPSSNLVSIAPQAVATGGAAGFAAFSAASTNSTNVKASAGTIYHISVQNGATAKEYLLFFNSASAPTCTGTPVYALQVPAVSSTGNAVGGIVEDFAVGLNFSTGIGFCATTAQGGTGSVAAGDLSINLAYK